MMRFKCLLIRLAEVCLMDLLSWVLGINAVVLIAIGVAGELAERRAARARRRAEEPDWDLLYSWLTRPAPPGSRDVSWRI